MVSIDFGLLMSNITERSFRLWESQLRQKPNVLCFFKDNFKQSTFLCFEIPNGEYFVIVSILSH